MNSQRQLRKLSACLSILKGKAIPSFSQSGEDAIVFYLFRQLGIEKPTYLDIGTNHPVIGNNTNLFYMRGSTGVCIEPDPHLCKLIRKLRPGATLLEGGVGLNGEEQMRQLYIFPHPYTGWNTFSEEEARKRETESGIKISEAKEVRLFSINNVIADHFSGSPDFLSIDVEGLDLDILKSLDFDRFAPKVICAETITFNTRHVGEKLVPLIEFVHEKGYISFADTYINTIFCRKDLLS